MPRHAGWRFRERQSLRNASGSKGFNNKNFMPPALWAQGEVSPIFRGKATSVVNYVTKDAETQIEVKTLRWKEPGAHNCGFYYSWFGVKPKWTANN
jgi:hypothetical protein